MFLKELHLQAVKHLISNPIIECTHKFNGGKIIFFWGLSESTATLLNPPLIDHPMNQYP